MFSNEAAALISFCSVGSVVGADGGKLEALYNKPTTDLQPPVFLSSTNIQHIQNKYIQQTNNRSAPPDFLQENNFSKHNINKQQLSNRYTTNIQ